MSITRRDLLAGAGGVFAASIAEAVSPDSAVAAKKQSNRATASAHNQQTESAIHSRSAAREFNGLYHNNYLNQIAFPDGWNRRRHDLPRRHRRAHQVLIAQPTRN